MHEDQPHVQNTTCAIPHASGVHNGCSATACGVLVDIGDLDQASPMHAREKIKAAWEAGCRNFDSALGGYGGCPMAEDKLVGNLSTETLLEWAGANGLSTGIDADKLTVAQKMLPDIFSPAS